MGGGGSKPNEAAIEQIQPVRNSTHTSSNERNTDATQKYPEVTLQEVQQEAPLLVPKADALVPESCTSKTPALASAPEKAPLRESVLEQKSTTSKACNAEVPMTPSAPAPPLKESATTETEDKQKAIIATQKEPKAEAVLSSPAPVPSLKESEAEVQKAEPEQEATTARQKEPILSSPASAPSLKESEAEVQKAEPEQEATTARQKEPKAEAVLSSPASVPSLKESEAEVQKAEPEQKATTARQKEPILSSPASAPSLKESEAEVQKATSAAKAESPAIPEMPTVEAASPATPVPSVGTRSPKSESVSQSKTSEASHLPGVDVDMSQTADVQEEKQGRNEQQKEEEYLPEFSATDEPFKELIVKKKKKKSKKNPRSREKKSKNSKSSKNGPKMNKRNKSLPKKI